MHPIDSRFAELFKGSFGLDAHEYEHLLSRFTHAELKKGDYYHRCGDISHSKAYVNKGCTRTFVTNQDGKESVLFFSFEDWWIADFESYYTEQPGKQYIQAMEDCELLCISKTDIDKLCEQLPKLKEMFEQKKQKMIFATINNLNEVKTFTAEER